MAEQQHPPLRLERVDALSDADRRWTARAAQLELDALPNLRASAEKWAAGLTGLLGAVGLAALLAGADEFAKLSQTWRDVGKGAFFGAAVLACISTWNALRAAQVTARKVFMPTPTEVRRLSEEGVDDALRKLAISRWTAAAAVVAILAAAFCVWWGPTETKSTTVSVSGNVCEGQAGKRLATATSGDTSVVIACSR